MKSLLTPSTDTPVVMGILNVTPDSFSDGGKYYSSVDIAVEHALQMVKNGAGIIDIGGESTRPGSERISAPEQINRVVPVISALAAKTSVPISIDTTLAAVASAAISAGASIINDISAFEDDPDMAATVARLNCPVIIMHKKGRPKDMQDDPKYVSVVNEVYDYLADRISLAVSAGVKKDNIIVDPGIGFGKTVDHNLELIRSLAKLHDLGTPVLLGASRKSFIGKVLDIDIPADRIYGDLAVLAYALTQGVDIVRVHEVKPAVQVVNMFNAISKQPI